MIGASLMDTISITAINDDELIDIAVINQSEAIKFDTLTNAIIEKGFSPIIKNNTWWTYDIEKRDFVDTKVPVTSKGEKGDSYIITDDDLQQIAAMVKSGVAPYIKDGFWYQYDETTKQFVNTGVAAVGQKGDKGDTGPAGSKGDTGAKGDKGDKGDTGPQGVEGPQGAKGDTGPRGPDGAKGDTGNGIAYVVHNTDYTLSIYFTDGTSYQTTSIRGEKGSDGAPGAQGTPGTPGAKGDTGNGISSAILNGDYTLTLRFTDGTSYTTPSIRGAEGPEGQPGTIDEATKQIIINSVLGQIPSWAKESTKPTYTAAEVGALPNTTVIPDDDHINSLIDEALGVIEDGYY